MKTLSIQQPWATLIAAGIKDVENRTWRTSYRGKLLIHASGKKVPKSIYEQLPLEWANLIYNAAYMGNISNLNELPTGAIVGYVDLTDCVEKTDSIWDGGPDCIKFIMKNAFTFDEPIRDVKGKLNIFEFPIEEENLPSAHRVELKEPSVEGDEFVMPISRQNYDELMANKDSDFLLYTTDELEDLLLKENCESADMKQKFSTIRFMINDGSTIRHQMVDSESVNFITDDEKKQTRMNLYGEDMIDLAYEFVIGKKI